MLKVNRDLFKLAFTYPCLMHASLAVALTYDRFLNTDSYSRRSLEECYHWSQSTALFNEKLRQPLKKRDNDPIWGTAGALAVLTFSSPDAYRPEYSWPLKQSTKNDLEWVQMINGKMSLWEMVEPHRKDSVFHVMAATFDQMQSPLPEVGVHGIPEPLADICLLHDLSTADNNPYFIAAHAVSRVLNLPDSEVTTGHTQIFTHSLDGVFKALLLEKDSVALLLLYLWYRKAGRSIWWIELRARVECPAIRMYVETYHGDDVVVNALLQNEKLVMLDVEDNTPDGQYGDISVVTASSVLSSGARCAVQLHDRKEHKALVIGDGSIRERLRELMPAQEDSDTKGDCPMLAQDRMCSAVDA
ncbi:hypothetical protein FPSE_02871 [Fusarium pseudograminearum CS3096]|uniref:Uncharacterized protein n=1 Tax=Fusarium pseudograminearum (strain CS3096) TaxID=1028729 RepID=K3UWF5_FUSPC|nr:hypothetical protein FPSE_02871 [Fusarium pseudograminearum CS3096]EKJ76996.1 hypothetical protein FPSE_02871 [Fusarium pseudograminearum CS3096]